MNSPSVSSPALADLAEVEPGRCLTELDARGPTPPNHLSAILAAMASLPSGRPQFVRTAAQPLQLLRALAAHGVIAETSALSDGTWRTILRSASANPSQ